MRTTSYSACPFCNTVIFEEFMLDSRKRNILLGTYRVMVPSTQQCAPQEMQREYRFFSGDEGVSVSEPSICFVSLQLIQMEVLPG